MTATTKLSGWDIYWDESDECWRFSDTGEPTAETYQERPCGLCHKFPTKEGHDACLGTLPGVLNACCGHGDVTQAYVMFDSSDRKIIRKEEALEYFKEVIK